MEQKEISLAKNKENFENEQKQKFNEAKESATL